MLLIRLCEMGFLKKSIRKMLSLLRGSQPAHSMYSGDYGSWAAAKEQCQGYDSENILNKVAASLLQVKNGTAVYERDSVLFDKIQYSWPLLAGLLRAAAENGNNLSVLDFGGSLGSAYFQNRGYLSSLHSLSWSIVEQAHFVARGRQDFADAVLKFYPSLDDALLAEKPNLLLLSSVVQYLPEPYAFLAGVIEKEIEYIIVDRTAFLVNEDGSYRDGELLTVQVVPEWIYPASYPAWFFNKQAFCSLFWGKYDLVAEWQGVDLIDSPKCSYEGLLLKRKSAA
jgi:putative methyltransferase (TIGR04325 family)